ncbi:MAG: hypothetical protein ACT4P4_27480 [Betaproteobacteria bacterium]
MKNRIRYAVLLGGLLVAAGADAQYRVSEIVAKGGQVMTAEQIRSEIVGRKVSGMTENGFQFELVLEPSGKLEGMLYTPRGAGGIDGKWSLNDKNQVCTDFVFSLTRAHIQRCNWYWKAGGEYYATNSRTDDQAAEKFVDCIMSAGKDCDGDFSVAKRNVRK